MPDKKRIQDLKAAFAFFDQNHDGQISLEELGLAMNKCGQYPSKLQLRMLMSECDKDKNGVITFDEFVCMMEGNQQRKKHSIEDLLAQFTLFDQDQDGFIDRDEMVSIVAEMDLGKLFPVKLIDQLFAEADVDGDGRISFEEFVAAVH